MNRPKTTYFFMVKYTDNSYEAQKVSKKLGIKLLTEIQIKEPVKFAQLVKDIRPISMK